MGADQLDSYNACGLGPLCCAAGNWSFVLRIALVLNDDFSTWQFRKGLIATLCRGGHTVFAYTPSGPWVRRLEEIGAIHRAIPLKPPDPWPGWRSEEHTSELQSHSDPVCSLLLGKKK